MTKKKLLILTGPTAIGKSDAAVEYALKTGCDVISADSMQVYRGLDIGTGKITKQEMRGVKHHMIDVAEPDEDYSVGKYVSEAEKIIDLQKFPPIICGGTGLYITSLVLGSDFGGVGKDEAIRNNGKIYWRTKANNIFTNFLKKSTRSRLKRSV